MNNVNSRIKLTTQTNHQLNRLILRSTRTRLEKTLIVTISTIGPYRSRQFSVNNQEGTEPCQLGHRFAQILLSYMWKFVNTGRNKKALKPYHTGRKHLRQLRPVSRNHTSP